MQLTLQLGFPSSQSGPRQSTPWPYPSPSGSMQPGLEASARTSTMESPTVSLATSRGTSAGNSRRIRICVFLRRFIGHAVVLTVVPVNIDGQVILPRVRDRIRSSARGKKNDQSGSDQNRQICAHKHHLRQQKHYGQGPKRTDCTRTPRACVRDIWDATGICTAVPPRPGTEGTGTGQDSRLRR